MRRLIVNADDLGLCPGVVAGVVHGFRRGIITSASIMMTEPGSLAAVESLSSVPGLDLGVHFTFTEGAPVLAAGDVPSLVDSDGGFLPAAAWLSGERRPDAGELGEEMAAQIGAAVAAGLAPTHLDLHTSAGYVVPEVFGLSVELAAEYSLAVRFPFGEGWEGSAPARAAQARFSAEALNEAVRRARDLIRAAGVAHTDRFVDAFPDLESCDAEHLCSLIRGLGEGTTEFLTHPAASEGCRERLGVAAEKRSAELRALCDRRVRRTVESEGIELIGFRDLMG